MIEVVRFRPDYAPAFAALNRQWIERYFELEDEDLKVLNDPQGYVLAGGGEIFFAIDVPSGDEAAPAVVGTVAMVKSDAGVYELAKMAVAPVAQGRGIARLLMDACLAFARRQDAHEVFLITNDRLVPAMQLYLKSGFVRAPANQDTRYARGNTEMRLRL